MNPLTIEQCVEQINARLAQEGLPATMNVRLLRHYQQLKSIPAPTQEGRFAKYSEAHVDAAVELRRAQDMGVSSKAYTTISNIDKHSDPTATVASLSLGTPAWLGNSLVGSLSASTAPAHALFASSHGAPTSSDNVDAHIARAIETAATTQTLAAKRTSMPPASQELLAQTNGASPREAALNALRHLTSTPSPVLQVPKAAAPSKTMAKLARAVSSASVSGRLPATNPSRKSVMRESTQWTLDHDVCVQIPTAALRALDARKLQAFEAWMAQLPDLT